jgi:hypothetical protein
MLGAIETVIGAGPGTIVKAALALLESVVLTTATVTAVLEVTACGAV